MPEMDSSPAGLPGLPLKERRNEIQLTLARHIMDPRGKTQGTVPAPASPFIHLHHPAPLQIRSWANPKRAWARCTQAICIRTGRAPQ